MSAGSGEDTNESIAWTERLMVTACRAFLHFTVLFGRPVCTGPCLLKAYPLPLTEETRVDALRVHSLQQHKNSHERPDAIHYGD